jgi:hypothetical protein
MDAPDNLMAGMFDQAGVIICDVVCRRCGYNLRGLREAGRCPECGTPIGLSTHGDLLRFADPTWVEKLAQGVRWMLWGIVVSIGVGISGVCLTGITAGGPAIQEVLGLLGSLVAVYGAWLLTAPDPSRIGEDRYVTARKVVRFGLIIGLLNQGIMIGIEASPTVSKYVAIFLVIPAILCGLVGVVAEFAKFLYMEKLAGRIPDPKLAGFARFLRWAYSIGLGALVLFGGLMVIGLVSSTGGTMAGLMAAATTSAPAGTSSPGPVVITAGPGGTGGGPGPVTVGAPPTTTSPAGLARPPGGLVGLMIAGACVFGVAMLVFWIMALVLYIRLGRRFREQAGIARATWVAATAGEAPPDQVP